MNRSVKRPGINTEFNRCRFAIINPAIGFTIPKYQLAAGITDIMMHTLERYFIPDSNAVLTDEIAEGLLRTVIKCAPAVLDNPENYDAMSEIFWASSISHNNLTECGREKDFSVHKLGHALSAKYGVTHGASLSAVWGAWANYLYKDCLSRFARFAEKVWGIKADSIETTAKDGIIKTVSFFSSIGMPVSLSGLGIHPSEEDIRSLSFDATMNDTVKLSKIKPLGLNEVIEIYRNALD